MLNKSGYSTKLYTSPNPNTLILKTHTHKQVMYYILYNICIDCGIRNANILSDLTAASVLKDPGNFNYQKLKNSYLPNCFCHCYAVRYNNFSVPI